MVEGVVRCTSVPIAGRFSPMSQVFFPVSRHGAVGCFGGLLADHHVLRDVAAWLVAGSGPWDAQGAAGARAGHELVFEAAAAFDVEGLVDRLVADAHGFVLREVDFQAGRDLLGAPGVRLSTVLAVRLVAPLPFRKLRPGKYRAVRGSDHARQAVLGVLP
ncbi:hypothetical protein [Streptomyces glaucus]|uniref:hypothetical protein n=1 Tax=Streptomyces glaucus TaxID=284029 RepID=UPI003CD07054